MSTRANANANMNAYAIECQKCGHAWLATLEAIRAGERAAPRCPDCEPFEARVPPAPEAAAPRLPPELGGKTWVITRARHSRR